MNDLHPAASHNLPSFITAPGETDVLMIVLSVILVLAILMFGSLFFRLHYLTLAFDEIRQYCTGSVQVMHRLRSALLGLADSVGPQSVPKRYNDISDIWMRLSVGQVSTPRTRKWRATKIDKVSVCPVGAKSERPCRID
jgi:hypothetical protein